MAGWSSQTIIPDLLVFPSGRSVAIFSMVHIRHNIFTYHTLMHLMCLLFVTRASAVLSYIKLSNKQWLDNKTTREDKKSPGRDNLHNLPCNLQTKFG